MLIGVITDSHDHLPNLRHALAELKSRGAEMVVHCGDLISPFVTRELAKFAGPVHTVFGNNDGDRFLSLKVAREAAPNVTHHGEFAFVDAAGHRLGLTHYREYAIGFAASAQCDAAFFGHSHQHHHETVNGRLVLNPGELLGLLGRPAFCLYDTATRGFERVEFDPRPW